MVRVYILSSCLFCKTIVICWLEIESFFRERDVYITSHTSWRNREIIAKSCNLSIPEQSLCRPTRRGTGAFWSRISIAFQKFGSRIDETGMFGVRLLPAELDSTILLTRLGQKCVTTFDPSYYLNIYAGVFSLT